MHNSSEDTHTPTHTFQGRGRHTWASRASDKLKLQRATTQSICSLHKQPSASDPGKEHFCVHLLLPRTSARVRTNHQHAAFQAPFGLTLLTQAVLGRPLVNRTRPQPCAHTHICTHAHRDNRHTPSRRQRSSAARPDKEKDSKAAPSRADSKTATRTTNTTTHSCVRQQRSMM